MRVIGVRIRKGGRPERHAPRPSRPWRPRPGNRADRRATAREGTPGSALLKPEHAASAARPWPSVKQPTVRTDRPHGPDAVRYDWPPL